MDAAKVARCTWEHACARGVEPRVFELAACDCGKHAGHIVRTHRPVSEEFVVSTVADMCCLAGTVALAVWTVKARPGEYQLMYVTAGGGAMVLEGGPFEFRQRGAAVGRLYAACLAALTPVPADDPLVLELASLGGS